MLSQVLSALAPAALLIALGVVLRHRQMLPDTFWAPAEWLSYYVLLPALFVHGLATADMRAVPVGAIFAVLIGAVLVTATLVILGRRLFGGTDPAFTSIFQGAIRFNNYVGVMIATGLYGAQGTALAAVANAAIVPTVNILSVLVFSRYGDARPGWWGVVRQVATNPLVLACVIGMGLQQTGIGLAPGLDASLKALGQAALAMGLLCVGAALQLGSLRRDLDPVLRASAVKFGLLPLITLGLCLLAGLRQEAAVVAMIFHALPTASSSFILSRQMGGDARLMASIIALQTLLAAAIMPVVVLFALSVLG